jgi:hypothetical protein
MSGPESLATQRCEVLLRLAVQQGTSGDRRQARQLYASALCEARRSGRLDLVARVQRVRVPCDKQHRTVLSAS